MIVGGLTRQDMSYSETKVPIIGDIPIIKYLTGIRSGSDAESTLFVFIRPVILRDDKFEDLKYISDRDLELAEMPANFPTSEPIVMQ